MADATFVSCGAIRVAATGTSDSFAVTVPSGLTNPILLIDLRFTATVSGLSATVAGNAMTMADQSGGWFFGAGNTVVFYRVGVSAGSNTVALSWTGSASVASQAILYQNVDQTAATGSTPQVTHATGSSTGTTISKVLTVDRSLPLLFVVRGNGNVVDAGGTDIRRSPSTDVVAWIEKSAVVTPAGSAGVTFTNATNAPWGAVYLALVPGGAVVTQVPPIARGQIL